MEFHKVTLRFDESLPNLIRAVREQEGERAWDRAIIVRDSAGRLGVAFRDPAESGNLSATLRDRLGQYALKPDPVLPIILFDAMLEAGPTQINIVVDEVASELKLLDRRVVGMDWLDDFKASTSGPPRLVFGSLKGGVGRTTALCVLAVDLAKRGKRVLCIDLDLEAPGIGSMLLQEAPEDARPKFGAIDYLVESALGDLHDDELYDHIGTSSFGGGNIKVLPAVGRTTEDFPENMIAKLGYALAEIATPEGRVSLSRKLRRMVDRFVSRFPADVVLIDSRAGLAEVTGATWLGIGAKKLLLFGIDQPQTFHGYRYILTHLVRTLGVPADSDTDDWRTRVSFVHARASVHGNSEQKFREHLHSLCASTIYDEDDGKFTSDQFNFSFREMGVNVPHDATRVSASIEYEAFNPIQEPQSLDISRYQGPFLPFLMRAWEFADLERAP